MTCKAEEIIQKLSEQEIVWLTAIQTITKEIAAKFMVDLSCVRVPYTKKVRTWKRLWLVKRTKEEASIAVKVVGVRKDYITIVIGEKKYHIDVRSNQEFKVGLYSSCPKTLTSYDTLLEDICKEIRYYVNNWTIKTWSDE